MIALYSKKNYDSFENPVTTQLQDIFNQSSDLVQKALAMRALFDCYLAHAPKVKDPKQAYNNLAGRLIDLIEEKLPVNPKFIIKMRKSLQETKKNGWIPLDEISELLNV